MKVQKVPGTLPYSALCAPYLRRSFEYLCSDHPVVDGGLFFLDYKVEKALCQGKPVFEVREFAECGRRLSSHEEGFPPHRDP